MLVLAILSYTSFEDSWNKYNQILHNWQQPLIYDIRATNQTCESTVIFKNISPNRKLNLCTTIGQERWLVAYVVESLKDLVHLTKQKEDVGRLVQGTVLK